MRARTLGATVLTVLLLGVTGCSTGDSGAGPREPRSEQDVAADPDATAAEIIAAGGPSAVATHDDTSTTPSDAGGTAGTTGSTGGTTLVAYTASGPNTEGPQQGAWRLYDHDGRRISDGSLGQVDDQAAVPGLVAVPDGYVITDYSSPAHRARHLTHDGTLTDVTMSRTRVPTRAGDVLLPGWTPAAVRLYRPGTKTSYRLPRLPRRGVENVALDATGRLWAQERWGRDTARYASSPHGTGPWTRTDLPLAPGGRPQTLQVLGDQVVATTAGAQDAVDAAWTRPVGGSPAGPWHRVPTTGAEVTDEELVVGVLPDPEAHRRRLVVAGGNQVMYVQGRSGTFSRLEPPEGVRSSELRPTSAGLFLVGSPDHHLYRSIDGASWDTVHR